MYLINARKMIHFRGVTDSKIRLIHTQNQYKVCDLK